MSKSSPPAEVSAFRLRYDELCAHRDAIENQVASLREKAKAAADEAEVYRVKSMEASEALRVARDNLSDRLSWFALKKDIGTLAKVLGNNAYTERDLQNAKTVLWSK